MVVMLASPDGRVVLRDSFDVAPDESPVGFGTRAAATLLDHRGGAALLEEVLP